MVMISAMSLAITKVLSGVAACDEPMPNTARTVRLNSNFFNLVTTASSMVVSMVIYIIQTTRQAASSAKNSTTKGIVPG
jgi:hypothetical protein